MSEHGAGARGGVWYRPYVLTWFWLLVITALELGVVFGGLSRGLVVALLVLLSLMKATLIGAYFMHLRYERLNLIFTIILPLVLILVLVSGVARDALNVFALRR